MAQHPALGMVTRRDETSKSGRTYVSPHYEANVSSVLQRDQVLMSTQEQRQQNVMMDVGHYGTPLKTTPKRGKFFLLALSCMLDILW